MLHAHVSTCDLLREALKKSLEGVRVRIWVLLYSGVSTGEWHDRVLCGASIPVDTRMAASSAKEDTSSCRGTVLRVNIRIYSIFEPNSLVNDP